MDAKCKLTTAVTNTCVHILHVCTYVQNLNLLQQKVWPVVLPYQPIRFTDQCYQVNIQCQQQLQQQ